MVQKTSNAFIVCMRTRFCVYFVVCVCVRILSSSPYDHQLIHEFRLLAHNIIHIYLLFFFHFSMYSTCKKPCFKCYALCMCIPIQFRQHQYTLAVLVVRCVLLSVFCLLFVSNSCYAMCDLFVSVCVSI